MGYFPYGSIEDEILSDTQYTQRQFNASDIEVVTALVKVLEYFTSAIESEIKNND